MSRRRQRLGHRRRLHRLQHLRDGRRSPPTGRYAKVVLTAGADKWWSIDELDLYGRPATTATTTSLSSSANPATDRSAREPIRPRWRPCRTEAPSASSVTGRPWPVAARSPSARRAVRPPAPPATCRPGITGCRRSTRQPCWGPSSSAVLTEAVDLPPPGTGSSPPTGRCSGQGAAGPRQRRHLGDHGAGGRHCPHAHGQGLLGGHGQRYGKRLR